MLGKGGARREVATKAPAAERNARRIDIGQTDRESTTACTTVSQSGRRRTARAPG